MDHTFRVVILQDKESKRFIFSPKVASLWAKTGLRLGSVYGKTHAHFFIL